MSNKAARDKLIAENHEWAQAIARHVASTLPTWFTHDDLTGPAEVALVKLACSYKPETNVPFRAFARRRIYGACFDSVRRREYIERSHAPLDDCDKACSRPTPETQALTAELAAERRDVWARVQQLPPRHTLVILARYAGNMTLVQISQLVGVGPERLSQIHHEALRMLQKTCAALEVDQ